MHRLPLSCPLWRVKYDPDLSTSNDVGDVEDFQLPWQYLQIFPQVFVVILKWLKCMIFASLPSKHHARIQHWCCLHPKHDTIWHMSVIIDRVGEHLALWVTVIMHACRINAEQHHHKHCGVSTLSVKLFEELQQNCVCFIVLSEECWSFLFAQRLGTIWETWPLFVAGGF